MKQKELQEFIYFFTHNKSLTRAQKLKIDVLLARDFANKKNNYNIETANEPNIVGKEKSKTNVKMDSCEKDYREKYIPPKNLQLFLRRFNQNDVLKYTCHEIDTDETIREICDLCGSEEYTVKKHSELISKAFDELNNQLISDKIFKDPKMFALISVYLTGETKSGQKQWSSLNVDTTWSSKELLDWSENNPGVIPSPGKNIAKKQKNTGYELPKAIRSNLTGNRILTFKELVLYFKSLFHIRRDNSLRDILSYVNKEEHYVEQNISIFFSEERFGNNIELFTDVDKLVQTYKHILDICRKCHKEGEKIIIELSFYAEENHVFFCIHDKESVYGKNLMAATTRIGELQKPLIYHKINGLCDLIIEADFDNKEYARIALWHENSRPLSEKPNVEVERLNSCQGVKYILRF